MFQEQFFPAFQLFHPEVKHFYQKNNEKFANAYSFSENDEKHETLLEKILLRKESQLPTSIEQFISFIAPYKGAFDCLCKLLLIAVTLPVTSASCESFSKMKLVKTFLRNSTSLCLCLWKEILSQHRIRH